MNRARRDRLILVGLIVTGVAVAVGLMLFALGQNVNLFYSPTQVARGEAPVGHTFRLGGMVVEGSVVRDPNSLKVQFALTDGAHEVVVQREGILPDLFREGQGIVAQGQLDGGGQFIAAEVLAKHDENYMPPEVEHAMETAKQLGLTKGK